MPNKIRDRSDRETFDRIDAEILESLQKDARLTNKELAERVGLAPSSCLERVRRLWEAGLFRGFHAEVEPRALGIGLEAMIAVRLARHSRDEVEGFRAHAASLPESRQVLHMAGASDFLLHVAVRDADHLRSFVLSAFVERPEVVHFETSLIYERVSNPVLPNYRRAAD